VKCYNHPENDAVALCSNCHRALCVVCAVPASDNRIYCVEQCYIIENSSKKDDTTSKGKKGYIRIILISLALSAISFIVGVLDRHFHWTQYANIWNSLAIALCLPLLITVMALFQTKLETWAYVKRKRKEKLR